ncbi:hypothetical protein WS83_20450 [Burkholderia sp. MSMB2042]|nr:hypothetical protein WS78_11600 [Burkholderia savannae]KVG37444.1 hypothetical protein WS77_01830 [Burkholderia sp. MSMB0265]KVG88291.1 hypothetical protein WS81_25395 [Burkholderia sp. MSMB2040]KVG93843.1 hypothetical protein WS82_08890 [Burkholderia sp. MSMB2041]KVH01094.1 hypothetical protein WS83_20450 [Burkholderia sp. MSMB2042]KVK89890.1 hypothetical protein WS91_27445 [Burkholderia sp. MSMB1498]
MPTAIPVALVTVMLVEPFVVVAVVLIGATMVGNTDVPMLVGVPRPVVPVEESVVNEPVLGVTLPTGVLLMPPAVDKLPESVSVRIAVLYPLLTTCNWPFCERIDLFGVVAPFPFKLMLAPFPPVSVTTSVPVEPDVVAESDVNAPVLGVTAPIGDASRPGEIATLPPLAPMVGFPPFEPVSVR